MLFSPVLLLLLLPAAADGSVPTFEYRDPVTMEILTCDRCPPGTHMTAYCTATTPTVCGPCRRDHFTELWNYLPKCLYCSNFCNENEEVAKECSPVNNRLCRCKEGFYLANDYCYRHTPCEPGSGVKTKGTSQANTVCETCSDGYFSNTSSAVDACVKHQQCAGGQVELQPGSAQQDTMCSTCEDLAKGGETLRTFLSGFFSQHKGMGKMKKFVNRYMNSSVPRQRGPLLPKIRSWLAQATDEQLWTLPDMLKQADLGCMSDKLVRRLLEIKQQSPGCSLTV